MSSDPGAESPPRVKIGSSTVIVVELTVVVTPLTVRLPCTVRLSPTVTSEVPCPILTAIPLFAVPTESAPEAVSILSAPPPSIDIVEDPSIVIAPEASISKVEESILIGTSCATPISIRVSESSARIPLMSTSRPPAVASTSIALAPVPADFNSSL